LHEQVLEDVAYSHVCFTIPKALRPTFLRERRLLGDLSRCAWRTLRSALRTTLATKDAVPAAVIASATAGDTAHAHPHLHSFVSWGAWADSSPDARFLPWPLRLDPRAPHRVVSAQGVGHAGPQEADYQPHC